MTVAIHRKSAKRKKKNCQFFAKNCCNLTLLKEAHKSVKLNLKITNYAETLQQFDETTNLGKKLGKKHNYSGS